MTELNYLGDDSLKQILFHELFERRVAHTPDSPALTCAERTLSYSELNERADRLAAYLRSLGVASESLVAVMLDRSSEMVVALLAVLKAGAAYLPLDPAYPTGRLSFMLEDSGAGVLLTQGSLAELLPGGACGAKVVRLDEEWEEIERHGVEMVGVMPVAAAEGVAYVIYTSGSTGRPKGVAVTHRSLTNFLHSMRERPGLCGDDVLLSVTPLSFDISALELYLPLVVGATVEVVSREVASDGKRLTAALRDSGATVLQATPATWRMLIESGWDGVSSVKALCGGEALSAELASQINERSRELWNMYGPTETTIWSSVEECTTVSGRPSIGRPIANTQLYVLDKNLRPSPSGSPGELYIAGLGLARGYLGRPELTAERFLPDPFSAQPGARMYRTGDVARFLACGKVEYMGRADQQVKVRGHRIELGEVEAALREHSLVREAAVVVAGEEAGGGRLVAYFVAEGEPAAVELRAHMKERLPEYMVPSAFVLLEAMPLTPNGKLDRKALPAEVSTETATQEYEAPRTELEQAVARAWQKILGVQRVSRNDDFFALGGHSLLMMRVRNELEKLFRIDVKITEMFKHPTVASLAEHIDRVLGVQTLRAESHAGARGDGDALEPLRLVRRDGARDSFPLSFGQQRLWFLHQMDGGKPLYNILRALSFKGRFDADALRASLNEVVRRHESLRTRFVATDGEPAQVVVDSLQLDIPLLDLTHLPQDERDAELRRYAERESHYHFNLAEGPLLRATLLRLRDDEHVLLLVMHHIVCDGWSIGLLFRELSSLYDAYSRNQDPALPRLPIQYADFAQWQREWLTGEVLDAQLSYWRERLADAPRVLELPTDRPRPAAQSFRGGLAQLELGTELSEHLRDVSRHEGVTVYMTLLAAFYALLARYTGQEDVLVGTPVANRNRAEVEPLIGFFVNTLALRADLSGAPSFRKLLKRVRETCVGAYAHQDVPFEKLVEELQPERSLSHTPLFQVMFALEDESLENFEAPGIRLRPGVVGNLAVKFDLTLTMIETRGGLSAVLRYSADLFDAATAERMLGHFRVLLESAVANPASRVSDLPLLTSQERQRLLVEWGEGLVVEKEEACAHELFERQATLTPDAVAVACGDEWLSYGELNRRANLLAHRLRRQGIGADSLVALFLERSTSALVAVLGVWKAGGAYVPLDVASPAERIAHMLEETGASVVVTQERLRPSLPAHAAAVVCVGEGEDCWPRDAEAEVNSACVVTKENLAYIIYTSGSTGRPKGVMIQHGSVTNLRAALHERIYSRQQTPLRVGLNAPLVFDGSVKQIVQLLSGHAVHIIPEEVRRDASLLLDYVRQHRLHALDITPSQLRVLAEAGLARGSRFTAATADGFPEFMLVGGEAVDEQTRETLSSTGIRFYNVYGPTECTVDATACEIEASRPASAIGRPLANVKTYVLDGSMRPVPAGVPGELYVGGAGLARGYFNSPALTAERFVPDSFSTEPGARLYRTGDVVRHLACGSLEYISRRDRQAKVRGFRVEPGEVEAALASCPGVRHAAVLVEAAGSADSRLVAYVTASAGAGELTTAFMRSYLRGRLPDYMVPTSFAVLDEMPLTPSGKVDREALRASADAANESNVEYVEPEGETQQRLAMMWAELLGAERVGAHDNFFDLGGHSLSIMRVLSRVRSTFQTDIPLRRFFETPTVSALSEEIEKMRNTSGRLQAATAIQPVTRSLRSLDSLS